MAKTVEETYQKKTPKEHILLRPDTYIGSVDKDTQTMYVCDGSSGRIVQRTISYAPGLYKIFDEILVNAADNKIRDPRMNTLKVTIDPARNEISVYNNGKGIPIKVHAKEGIYVPELIFGHLLTSSNYDDDEKKVTGGRNGYGAKLCNIFSTEFTVETADGRQRYRQRFLNNMDVTEPPAIEGCREEYTRITFRPDLRRFKMNELDADVVALLQRRVYDMCATLRNVRVFLDGSELGIHSFKEYVHLYVRPEDKVVYQRINDRWELAFTVADDQFGQVSFVNSIATTKGGTHVTHVMDQLVEQVLEAVKKKEKALDIKPVHVKSSVFLFVNCLIENPSFDSQTKENLTLRAASFGSKCQPLEGFVREIVRSTPLVERIVSFSRAKQSAQLKKTDGSKTSRLTGIPKLEDANHAGTRRSRECTLILTEGDSAKTLAVAGLSVVGRDCYGVFPLRGKLLNVREANHQQIMANAEISSIKKILGLQHGKAYEDVDSLRYGHIMIMTDQDHDGSHIKGLIINFLDHFFPSLLRIKGFLQEFITPIIRATRQNRTIDFFTIPEFESFREEEAARTGSFGWTIKYYKGLGTSTSKDAKQYFSDLGKHVKDFAVCSADDRGLIDLAFNKKKTDMRKAWLAEFVPGTFLDQSASTISITDFVNRELILFSMADNIRSIPSVIDGLKPGQRKVIFSCFKRNLRAEIKVAQLVGYVSEQSAYHHGEASLCATIVNLAHDFVGSNNINLLLPLGSFGSRLQGGKDAASPRYIYTNLNPLTRLLFPEHDDPVLSYQTEDNMQIEPEYYVPILPMVLINGADGIGTGWSTSIPNYDPIDIIKNVRLLMRNEEMQAMAPYYRNFRGEVVAGDGRFVVTGTYETNGECISVTELPVGTWTQTYKEYLESLVQSGTIRDYKEYHTEKTVDFLVARNKDFPLKLATTISTSNMICFDPEGKIKRYETPLDIIREFCPVRLRYYGLRKEHRLAAMGQELLRLANKVRFIKDVTEERLIIYKRPANDIVADLDRMGYERLDDYEYLLGMKISSLTKERMERLIADHGKKEAEYNDLLRKTPNDLWNDDLEKFEVEYLKMVETETAEYNQELKNKMKRHTTMPKMAKGSLSAKDLKGTKEGKAVKGTKNAKAKKVADGKPAKAVKVKKAAEPKKKIKAVDDVVVLTSSEEERPWDKYNK